MTNSKMSQKIFYVCVLTVFLYPHLYYGCPTMCTCSSERTVCINEGLTEVPSGIPETTEELSLYQNSISSLPEGVFESFADLKTLYIGYNSLTSLPEGLFSKNPALSYVDIRDNSLTSLPEGLFSKNPALSYMHINENQLTSLPEGLFLNNSALNVVFFSVNQITSVPEGLFSNNPDLTIVSFYKNAITSLPNRFFLNNPALRYVDFGGNQIPSVPEGFFSNNPALETMYFYKNAITSLPKRFFLNNPALRSVDFGGNQIPSVPEGFFSNNPALETINLNVNLIKTVSPNVFPDASSISGLRLFLGGNPLLCCNMSDTIDWIQNLTEINLDRVTCIENHNTDKIELVSFNTSVCLQVDGQWSDWSESNCSSICGVGNMTRTRECNNPEPSLNGQECQGEASDVIQCYRDCSTDKEFNWMPLVIGLVVGACFLIGTIVLVAVCVLKSKCKKISDGS